MHDAVIISHKSAIKADALWLGVRFYRHLPTLLLKLRQ